MLTDDQKWRLPKFLGIGSAFNIELGNTSCFYYKEGDAEKNIIPEINLIDCGWDVFSKLKKYGYLEDKPNINIYITHLHGDHIGSLSTLLEYSFHVNKRSCRIYYHNEKEIRTLLDSMIVEPGIYSVHDAWLADCGAIRDKDKLNHLVPHIIKHDKINNSYVFKMKHPNHFGTSYFAWDSAGVSPDIYNDFITELVGVKNLKDVYLFHDCCLANYPGNVHTYYKLLLDLVPEDIRSHVFPVHIDDERVLNIMVDAGFGDVRELRI